MLCIKQMDTTHSQVGTRSVSVVPKSDLSCCAQLEQQKTDSIEEVIQGACEPLDEHSRDNAADALRRAIQQGSIAATPDSQTGFAALGGLQAQKRALQELVVLPLQASSTWSI